MPVPAPAPAPVPAPIDTPGLVARPLAVLFDLDGTLIDTIALLLASVHAAFDGHDGPAPTEEEWIAGIGTPLWIQLAQFARDESEIRTLTDRYRAFQRREHDRLTAPYPGALDAVRQLHDRGHPLGIVTSKSNEMMNRSLVHTGLAPYMSVAIGADACTRHKPDPFPVELALQSLGYSPHEAVFVGDSPHDVNAGNSAGVTTIAALWGPFTREQLRPANPAVWLESIADLPATVARIQSRAAV